jgi:hypothetical protein
VSEGSKAGLHTRTVNDYRSAQWHEFRQTVHFLDGHLCIRCGKGVPDGAVLQVHHTEYLPGRKPWEYPPQLCETLCKGCHAIEHGIIPPQHGWEFIGHEDLGDRTGECECCGMDIRHVFLITHDRWRPMEVGTDCCDNLTCSEIASNHVDSIVRYRKRRSTFIASPRWLHRGYRNEQWRPCRTAGGRPDGEKFRLVVDGRIGKRLFATAAAAKAHAFDALEDGGIDAWITKTFLGR